MRLGSLILGCAFPGVLLSASELWLDVPFVSQVKDGCGTACISMVMQYWHRHSIGLKNDDTEEPVVRDAIPFRRGQGVMARDMELYLRNQGFRTYSFRGEWRDLSHHLSRGRPLVVCLRVGRSKLHYVVVAGVDPGRNLVLVNDPARRKLLKLKRSEFESGWKGTGNWTLLALP